MPRSTALLRTADVLHSAALRLLRRAALADATMDLDGPRASLLSILVFAGPQSMGRLAELERVTPAAITKLVAALEKSGLVQRMRDATDRRIVRVLATPAGRIVLERGRAARVAAVADLLTGLPPADLATLRRAAEILASRVGYPQSGQQHRRYSGSDGGDPGQPRGLSTGGGEAGEVRQG